MNLQFQQQTLPETYIDSIITAQYYNVGSQIVNLTNFKESDILDLYRVYNKPGKQQDIPVQFGSGGVLKVQDTSVVPHISYRSSSTLNKAKFVWIIPNICVYKQRYIIVFDEKLEIQSVFPILSQSHSFMVSAITVAQYSLLTVGDFLFIIKNEQLLCMMPLQLVSFHMSFGYLCPVSVQVANQELSFVVCSPVGVFYLIGMQFGPNFQAKSGLVMSFCQCMFALSDFIITNMVSCDNLLQVVGVKQNQQVFTVLKFDAQTNQSNVTYNFKVAVHPLAFVPTFVKPRKVFVIGKLWISVNEKIAGKAVTGLLQYQKVGRIQSGIQRVKTLLREQQVVEIKELRLQLHQMDIGFKEVEFLVLDGQVPALSACKKLDFGQNEFGGDDNKGLIFAPNNFSVLSANAGSSVLQIVRGTSVGNKYLSLYAGGLVSQLPLIELELIGVQVNREKVVKALSTGLKKLSNFSLLIDNQIFQLRGSYEITDKIKKSITGLEQQSVSFTGSQDSILSQNELVISSPVSQFIAKIKETSSFVELQKWVKESLIDTNIIELVANQFHGAEEIVLIQDSTLILFLQVLFDPVSPLFLMQNYGMSVFDVLDIQQLFYIVIFLIETSSPEIFIQYPTEVISFINFILDRIFVTKFDPQNYYSQFLQINGVLVRLHVILLFKYNKVSLTDETKNKAFISSNQFLDNNPNFKQNNQMLELYFQQYRCNDIFPDIKLDYKQDLVFSESFVKQLFNLIILPPISSVVNYFTNLLEKQRNPVYLVKFNQFLFQHKCPQFAEEVTAFDIKQLSGKQLVSSILSRQFVQSNTFDSDQKQQLFFEVVQNFCINLMSYDDIDSIITLISKNQFHKTQVLYDQLGSFKKLKFQNQELNFKCYSSFTIQEVLELSFKDQFPSISKLPPYIKIQILQNEQQLSIIIQKQLDIIGCGKIDAIEQFIEDFCQYSSQIDNPLIRSNIYQQIFNNIPIHYSDKDESFYRILSNSQEDKVQIVDFMSTFLKFKIPISPSIFFTFDESCLSYAQKLSSIFIKTYSLDVFNVVNFVLTFKKLSIFQQFVSVLTTNITKNAIIMNNQSFIKAFCQNDLISSSEILEILFSVILDDVLDINQLNQVLNSLYVIFYDGVVKQFVRIVQSIVNFMLIYDVILTKCQCFKQILFSIAYLCNNSQGSEIFLKLFAMFQDQQVRIESITLASLLSKLLELPQSQITEDKLFDFLINIQLLFVSDFSNYEDLSVKNYMTLFKQEQVCKIYKTQIQVLKSHRQNYKANLLQHFDMGAIFSDYELYDDFCKLLNICDLDSNTKLFYETLQGNTIVTGVDLEVKMHSSVTIFVPKLSYDDLKIFYRTYFQYKPTLKHIIEAEDLSIFDMMELNDLLKLLQHISFLYYAESEQYQQYSILLFLLLLFLTFNYQLPLQLAHPVDITCLNYVNKILKQLFESLQLRCLQQNDIIIEEYILDFIFQKEFKLSQDQIQQSLQSKQINNQLYGKYYQMKIQDLLSLSDEDLRLQLQNEVIRKQFCEHFNILEIQFDFIIKFSTIELMVLADKSQQQFAASKLAFIDFSSFCNYCEMFEVQSELDIKQLKQVLQQQVVTNDYDQQMSQLQIFKSQQQPNQPKASVKQDKNGWDDEESNETGEIKVKHMKNQKKSNGWDDKDDSSSSESRQSKDTVKQERIQNLLVLKQSGWENDDSDSETAEEQKNCAENMKSQEGCQLEFYRPIKKSKVFYPQLSVQIKLLEYLKKVDYQLLKNEIIFSEMLSPSLKCNLLPQSWAHIAFTRILRENQINCKTNITQLTEELYTIFSNFDLDLLKEEIFLDGPVLNVQLTKLNYKNECTSFCEKMGVFDNLQSQKMEIYYLLKSNLLDLQFGFANQKIQRKLIGINQIFVQKTDFTVLLYIVNDLLKQSGLKAEQILIENKLFNDFYEKMKLSKDIEYLLLEQYLLMPDEMLESEQNQTKISALDLLEMVEQTDPEDVETMIKLFKFASLQDAKFKHNLHDQILSRDMYEKTWFLAYFVLYGGETQDTELLISLLASISSTSQCFFKNSQVLTFKAGLALEQDLHLPSEILVRLPQFDEKFAKTAAVLKQFPPILTAILQSNGVIRFQLSSGAEESVLQESITESAVSHSAASKILKGVAGLLFSSGRK